MDLPRLPLSINVAGLAQMRRKLGAALPTAHTGPSRLTEQAEFGADPGGLRMMRYVPDDLKPGAPLVVVLHGCTQTADGYDTGTGWSTLAERHGFGLLMPEQRRANNPNLCYNWFEPADITRGTGEVASIRAMVAAMAARYRMDPARVFVCGLSAGGAMTAALLATYPEVFAAGAVIAGLPFGSAANVSQAMAAMGHPPVHPGAYWGDLVRRAAPTPARLPRVTIWHGDADTTVRPANAAELAKQWCNVHGLQDAAATEDQVDGIPHQAWLDRAGTVQVETFTVPGMGHGAPVDTQAPGDRGVGHAMAHIPDCGVSSTWRIARNWGLVPDTTAGAARPAAAKPAEGPAALIERTLRASGLLG